MHFIDKTCAVCLHWQLNKIICNPVQTYQEDGELAHFPLVIDKEDEMRVPRVNNEVVMFAERLDMLV